MTVKEIKVVGLAALQEKLDADVLLQPEIDDAIETIVTRVERQGKGLGAQRNTLSSETQALGATVTTTLNYPRTKGTSWGRKNEAVIKAMGPRVAKKAIERIEARWAGGGA